MRRLLLFLIFVESMYAVGSVSQSFTQIANSNTWVLAINWVGDSMNGTVPATAAQFGLAPVQGFRAFSLEIAPGIPAPTNFYNVTLTTFLGDDILLGAGTALSNTLATQIAPPASTPPLYGTLTVNITGNSVPSAQGKLLIYFAPLAQIVGLAGGPSLNGTNTFTGANTFTGINTFTGTNTFTGLVQCKNFENELCVDSTFPNGGLNIGDDLNKAYLNSSYVSTSTVKINVYLPTTNVCYSFSTPILLATNVKPVVVDFHGGCLSWTGSSSGAAITLDTGIGNTIVSSSIQNLHLTTGGINTATGIIIGASGGNGCNNCSTYNVEIDGFHTGMALNAFNTMHQFPKIQGDGTVGSIALNKLGGTDDTRLYGGFLSQANTLLNDSGGGPIEIFGTQFIDAKGGAAGTNVYISVTTNDRIACHGCHLSALTIAPTFLNQTTGRTYFYGSLFEDDLVSGTPTQYMTISGGYLYISGGDISSLGESVTQMVTFSGTASGEFYGIGDTFSPSRIPLIWNNTYTGAKVIECGTQGITASAGCIIAGNDTDPTINQAAFYQSGSTAKVSGFKFQVRAGTTPADAFDINNTGAASFCSGCTLSPGGGLVTPLANNTALQMFNTTTTCTTGASVGATCTTANISLPVAEADTSYRVTCTGKGLTNVPVVIATANASASQFTITIAALTAAAASFTSYDCVAGHN